MIKKTFNIVAAVISTVALSLAGIAPANASSSDDVVVIIDSVFDTSKINGEIVLELCMTSHTSGCNNGSSFEQGPGAAESGYSPNYRSKSDWDHGNLMAQSVLAEDPGAKLILIRNAKLYSNGNVFFGSEQTLEMALAWVENNHEQYNISAVLMSRGSNAYFKSSNRALLQDMARIAFYTRYINKLERYGSRFSRHIDRFSSLIDQYQRNMSRLPNIECPASATVSLAVSNLAAQNIASIFATGNDGAHKYVDSPACLDDAIAVAASDNNKILGSSNIAENTDFAVNAPNTSIAAAKLAGMWSANYNDNYTDTVQSISTGVVTNRFGVVLASTN